MRVSATVLRRLAYVLAKEPEPGRVKTRLCPPLTPEEAARCHEAFLGDLLERLARLAGVTVRVAAAPGLGGPRLRALAARSHVSVEPQGDGDLGRRMERVVLRGLAEAEAVVLLGADVPDVPLALVERAFDVLASHSVVVGPAADGGYYLIGAARTPDAVAGLFDLAADGIAWGGAQVLEATLARLQRAATSFALLPSWCDVDDDRDLRRLAVRARAAATSHELPATFRLLEELAARGVRF